MAKIITTQDGSNSVISSKFGVSYHSLHGAVDETNKVFIEEGLIHFIKTNNVKRLKIFELGFGTGLNVFQTFKTAKVLNLNIDFTTIEKYPLNEAVFSQLNYPSLLDMDEEEKEYFFSFHTKDTVNIQDKDFTFNFSKITGDIIDWKTNSKFDIIYFDAFAPNSQPYLWVESMMTKMYDILNFNGILVTYCSKGDFKRTLRKVGFTTEHPAGPIGKREITRAIKPYQ